MEWKMSIYLSIQKTKQNSDFEISFEVVGIISHGKPNLNTAKFKFQTDWIHHCWKEKTLF